MRDAAIEVERLTKRYRAEHPSQAPVLAVDGVSFRVDVGEVFGFLGPNGAGKTTTVHILTTLIRGSGGRASVLGEDVARKPLAVRRAIGIVPEVSNVYEEYSAWDNLIFTARLYGVGRVVREERAQELLTRFDLWDRRASRTAGFSKGMKRRLCIAMGLMHDPRVLFLDEPTSGLDVQSSIAIRDTIRRLKAGGTTIFLTTHNMDEAARVCDRVAVIHRGRLAAVDTPLNLAAAASSLVTIEVFFERDGDWAAELSRVPSVTEVVREGERWKLRTAVPSQVIPAVVDWSRAQGLAISALNTVSPSLEEVFVQLTSARCREEGDG
jgi:ABC-2 type transport system ATP-binding protein